jgi:hypothetical protein
MSKEWVTLVRIPLSQEYDASGFSAELIRKLGYDSDDIPDGCPTNLALEADSWRGAEQLARQAKAFLRGAGVHPIITTECIEVE